MLFNSAQFLIFFPIAALGYYLIPHKLRYLWLLICSYFFYMCWNPAYALLLAFSTLITYLSALAVDAIRASEQIDPKRKTLYMKLCLSASLILNLSILCYFKYANFFIANINSVLGRLNISYAVASVNVLLPVGISFYTFQAAGYLIDVYRGELRAERNPLKYALFVSFFPQLVAGPIERSRSLLSQFDEKHDFDPLKLRSGFMLMLWGYFLKLVLADRIAIFVNGVYNSWTAYPGWYLIMASFLFAIQIYCDFAGYSTIAKGAAEIMGFKLTDNFQAPYLSASVSEFWRRWHVSLSSWFRDYVYIPLGGNRRGKIRKYVNLMIVFILSGLWHGARWSFVAWGALNGIYQIFGELSRPVRDRLVTSLGIDRRSYGHRILQTVLCFILVDVSWIFFRAGGLNEAFPILKSIFTAGNINILFDGSLYTLGLDAKDFGILTVSLCLLLFSDIFKYRGLVLRDVIAAQDLWFRWLVLLSATLGILIFGIWGSGYDASTFIYFQF